MTAALVMADLILAILAACGWAAFYMAQDQAAELRRERDLAEARAARLSAATRGMLLDPPSLSLVEPDGGEGA